MDHLKILMGCDGSEDEFNPNCGLILFVKDTTCFNRIPTIVRWERGLEGLIFVFFLWHEIIGSKAQKKAPLKIQQPRPDGLLQYEAGMTNSPHMTPSFLWAVGYLRFCSTVGLHSPARQIIVITQRLTLDGTIVSVKSSVWPQNILIFTNYFISLNREKFIYESESLGN